MKYTLKRRVDFSVQKNYSRKGKLNEKKKSCTPINPKKIFMLWLKKIRTRNLVNYPPPSHNFSNGPSLGTQKGVIVLGGPSGDRGNWD